MSNKNKRKTGVKTFHRYSPGAFITGIFSLAIVGCLGAFVILPLFTFTREGEAADVFKGLDYILLGVRQFYSNVVGDRFNSFLSFFNTYEGDNQLLNIICQFHNYIELGLIAVIAVVALLAFIEACLAVVWIVGGKISKPKATLSLGWAIFILFGLDIGLFFLYLTFYGELLKAAAEEASAVFNIYALLPLGGIFFSLIVMGITHKVCFKNRVFADKKRTNKNKVNDEVVDDNNQANQPMNNVPAPQPTPVPSPAPQQNQTPTSVPLPSLHGIDLPEDAFLEEADETLEIPAGTTAIADHAYAKNLNISKVELPEGVVSIGGGAFANCHNLVKISLPRTLLEIGYNTFFDTPKLKTINYAGTKEDWTRVKRGSNWLTHSGTTIVNTADGPITVNTSH